MGSIASSNNGLLELRCAAQTQEALGLRVEERIANAICKNPRIMKAGITLEFKEVIAKVSKHMIANMDKLRTNRLKDGVQPGSGALWVPPRLSTDPLVTHWFGHPLVTCWSSTGYPLWSHPPYLLLQGRAPRLHLREDLLCVSVY